MPIPFLIPVAVKVAATVVGGVTTIAISSINKEAKNEVQSYYDEAEKLIEKTNISLKNEQRLLELNIKTNEEKKKAIYDIFIKPFCMELSKIKATNLREMETNGKHICEALSINDFSMTYYGNGTGTRIKNTIKEVGIYSLGGPVASFVFGYIQNEKLESQKKVAKGKLEEVKLQCEKINNEIAASKEIRAQVREVTELLKAMETYLHPAYFYFTEIIRKAGYNYREYSDEYKEKLMVIKDIFKGINSIIIKPIVKKNGEFNTEIINAAVDLKNRLQSEQFYE